VAHLTPTSQFAELNFVPTDGYGPYYTIGLSAFWNSDGSIKVETSGEIDTNEYNGSFNLQIAEWEATPPTTTS